MNNPTIAEIREDLRKADAGCEPEVYCEYSCASCAAESRLEDIRTVRFLLAEIDRLTKEIIPKSALAQMFTPDRLAELYIETKERLGKRDADVIQIDEALQAAYVAIEKLQVKVMKQDEALREIKQGGMGSYSGLACASVARKALSAEVQPPVGEEK